jgi:hypothetical protein
MSRKVPNLPRVRATLAKLDTLAGEHPEAFADRTAEDWLAILQENEEMNPIEGTMPTGRPRSAGLDAPERERSIQVAVRLSPPLLARVDAWLDSYRGEHPGVSLSRSDAIRALVTRELDAGGHCGASKAGRTCTLHRGHAGSHYDSTADKSWK